MRDLEEVAEALTELRDDLAESIGRAETLVSDLREARSAVEGLARDVEALAADDDGED